MSPRVSSFIAALVLVACELPEPAGPKPTQAGLAPSPTASLRDSKRETTIDRSAIRQLPSKKLPTEDAPSEPPAADAPSGAEAGPLVGLRTAHDKAREAVGVAPLTWSTKVAAHAQDWANQLAANNCQLQHRPNNPYGENLYWSTSTSATPAEQVVAAWVAESAHYDASTNTCAGGQICGHYTQVVWAKTTSLGCGRATCGNTEVWVCDYDPRGNYAGQAPF